MYENKLSATCADATSPAVAEAVDALSALIATVNEKVASHTVEASDVDALHQGVAVLQEARRTASSLVTPMADTQNAMPAYQLNGMRYTGGKGLVVTKGKKFVR